jgi:hypothetical protein
MEAMLIAINNASDSFCKNAEPPVIPFVLSLTFVSFFLAIAGLTLLVEGVWGTHPSPAGGV